MKLVIDNKSRIGWVLGRIKNAILGRVKREKKKYYPFSRTIMNQHIEHFIKTNEVNGNVLEVGGFKNRKKKYIHNYISYISINIVGDVDVSMDGQNLAFRDKVFDLVLINQVLEHVKYPMKVLTEAYRVLRPQGYIIVGVPMLVPIHADPYDFWRFTPSGLAIILQDSGFTNVYVNSWGHKLAVKEYLELFPYSAKGVDSYEKWEGITQTRNDTTFPLHCWGFAQKI